MGLRFIFMLTRNDRTVPDASQQLQTALSLGVRHIGFKDIGLPVEQLKALNAAIKAGGATSYLEVVSLDRESEIVSAKAAVEIGVDVLLGGTRVDDVLPIINGTGIQYFPFPGRITGHPSVLEGTIEEIVESARTIAGRDGVHGLDLLAYRSAENVPELMKAVCAAVSKPVYIAGSIDTRERIAVVQSAGAVRHIDVIGIDCHIGSQLTEIPPFIEALERLKLLIARLKEIGICISTWILEGDWESPITRNRRRILENTRRPLYKGSRSVLQPVSGTRPRHCGKRRRAADRSPLCQEDSQQRIHHHRCRHERSLARPSYYGSYHDIQPVLRCRPESRDCGCCGADLRVLRFYCAGPRHASHGAGRIPGGHERGRLRFFHGFKLQFKNACGRSAGKRRPISHHTKARILGGFNPRESIPDFVNPHFHEGS